MTFRDIDGTHSKDILWTEAGRVLRIDRMAKKDLSRLEEITAEMADTIRPMFQGMEHSHYVAYLNTMFHFLQEKGKRLKSAVEICEDEDLQDLFSRASGNADHRFDLVKADLKALGEEPTDEVPEAIGQFDEFWASIDSENEVSFLGAFYVMENLGEYVKDDVAGALDEL